MLAMNNLYAAVRAASAGKSCFIFALTLLFAPTLLLADLPAPAQAAPAAHAFEVATIKPSDLNNPPPESVNLSPDGFQATGMTLKELIKVAWDLDYGANDQVVGGPPWTASTRFDLDAKEDPEFAAEIAKLPHQQQGVQIRSMLRDLIIQRFQLRLHHDTRELPVYELVVAKGGPKMLPGADAATPQNIASQSDAPQKSQRWIRFVGVGELEGDSADMATLVTALCMQPEIGGRMVLDKTALAGNYDFTLKWTPDIMLNPNQSAPSSGPSLFTALQEELGLRLDSARAPVDRIVIDSVSPPVAN
jgi:uncharacterized protein (TIGR03435 family)